MTHRVLPESEWPRLEGTPLGDVWRLLPTDNKVYVLVAEDADGAIIAHWTLFLCAHAENVWVHPDHRKKGVVVRHLLAGLRDMLDRYFGRSAFITHADTDEVKQLLISLGASRLPGDAYSVPFRKD